MNAKLENPCFPLTRDGKANARRKKIVQAARELFEEHGFHATGMARISQRSGVLVGQIYRDFANKEAIVAAIVERDLDEFLSPDALCAAAMRGETAEVRAWIRNFVAGRELPDLRLVTEILAEAARNERIAQIFRHVDSQLRVQLIAALGVLLPETVPSDRIECLADAVVIFNGGTFQHRLSDAGGLEECVIDLLMTFIDREIAALTAAFG